MKETSVTVEKIMYVAEDGTTFDRKKDCVKYESKSKFDALVKEKGQCIRCIYDDGIKELVEYYLDMKDNKLASCTELYLAKVDDYKDAEQVACFCEMKEGDSFDHWYCQFNNGKRYLICVHSSMTKMYGEDNLVFVIPYDKFKEFWSVMMCKIETLKDYELPIVNDEHTSTEVKSPFKHFNEIIKDFGNSGNSI